jgi:hypothetical protein
VRLTIQLTDRRRQPVLRSANQASYPLRRFGSERRAAVRVERLVELSRFAAKEKVAGWIVGENGGIDMDRWY